MHSRPKASFERQDKSFQDKSSLDMDPYSTAILDELLESPEWNHTEEIVRLAFKAFKDFVEIHSGDIKDLKTLLTTRAAKQELSTGLSLKANVSDLARVVEEISSALDAKIGYAEVQGVLSEYARKKDLTEILAMGGLKETESKSKIIDREIDAKMMEVRFEEFQKEVCKKIGACVTFSEFNELSRIVDNKVSITEMNDVLENRVTKQYLSTCLQKKLSKSDVENLLAKKADVSDLELIVNSLEMKASLPTIEKLTQIIENKADRSDLTILSNEKKLLLDEFNEKLSLTKQSLESKLSDLTHQIENSRSMLNQALKSFEKDQQNSMNSFITTNELTLLLTQQKSDISESISALSSQLAQVQNSPPPHYENFKKELISEINLRKRCEEKIYEEIDELRKTVEEISMKKVDKTEFFDFKSALAEELDQKIETEHVQEAFNKWEVELTHKMEEDREEVYQVLRKVQQSLTESITQNTKDISNLILMGKSAQNEHSFETVSAKNRKEVEECRKTVDAVYGEIRNKLDISEYESDLLEIRKKFDMIERENSLKANIKDVCVLADSKPNIEDVNRALKEINLALQEKISETDLQEVIKDQSTVNETLLCQNIIGRWVWQSGDLRAGGLVPWESEYANTVPDYYFWEKDKSSILVLVGGIYEIVTAVFGRGVTPTLLINGESIMQKDPENQNTSNMPKKLLKKKKDKEIIGNKIIEYFMLPPRSRISVTVNVEGGEGVLNIRRL